MGFITTVIVYIVFKRQRGHKSNFINYSGIRILLTDFWFDGFLIRKIISITYFFSLVIFNSVIWNEIINYKDTFYYGPLVKVSKILVLIMFLIGVRILLELSVSVIKISENTTVIREYLTSKSDIDEKILEEGKEDETPVRKLKPNDYNIPR